MIQLTKLNGTAFVLNSDLIETIEEMPDTTIRLVTKNYYIVEETMEEVIRKVAQFRQTCNHTYVGVLDELKGRTE